MSMHISLRVLVVHNSYIEGFHMTKNTASSYKFDDAEQSVATLVMIKQVRSYFEVIRVSKS
jgi:hypothetical protein